MLMQLLASRPRRWTKVHSGRRKTALKLQRRKAIEAQKMMLEEVQLCSTLVRVQHRQKVSEAQTCARAGAPTTASPKQVQGTLCAQATMHKSAHTI